MSRHKEANRLIKGNHDNFLSGPKRNLLYDTEKIAAHADKILRYEITFRNSYLSKIFWTKVFRFNVEKWQTRMEIWRECRKVYMASMDKHNIKKELREFWLSVYLGRVNASDDEVQNWISHYRQNFKHIDISIGLTKSQKEFYKWWSKQRDKRVAFNLEVSERVANINTGRSQADYMGGGIEKGLPNEAWFSPKLLKECFRIFNKFREEFKIEKRTTLNDAFVRAAKYDHDVEEHNKQEIVKNGFLNRKQKLQMGKYKAQLLLLQQYTPEQLVEKGIMSRWTVERWKKKSELIDLNFKMGSIENLWNCWGFEEYHSALQRDNLNKYLFNYVFM